jgi:hypothetical protein
MPDVIIEMAKVDQEGLFGFEPPRSIRTGDYIGIPAPVNQNSEVLLSLISIS